MKKLVFLLFLSIATLKGYSSALVLLPEPDSTLLEDVTPKNPTILLNFGQLFRKEVQISYKQPFNDWLAAEISLGYKFATQKDKPYENVTPSLYSPEHFEYAESFPYSKGYLAGLALKAYNGKRAFYFSPGFFYRYRAYDHQLLENAEMDSQGSENWTSQQSLKLKIYGIKLLGGNQIDFGYINSHIKLIIEFYYGFSYRWKDATTAFDWKSSTNASYSPTPVPPAPTTPIHTDYPPTIEKTKSEAFSPQLGLKFGFRI